MASSGDATASNLLAHQGLASGRSQRDSQRGGPGRARGRGGGSIPGRSEPQERYRDRHGGGQGRGGQRVNDGHGRSGNAIMGSTDLSSESSKLPISDRPLAAKMQPANTRVESQEVHDGLEAEVCFICASPVFYNSVAPCNHRTCHICALRMRALYKTKDCAHCRVSPPSVIY
jgi:E3 ubiquitin-protein ligase ZNF598